MHPQRSINGYGVEARFQYRAAGLQGFQSFSDGSSVQEPVGHLIDKAGCPPLHLGQFGFLLRPDSPFLLAPLTRERIVLPKRLFDDRGLEQH